MLDCRHASTLARFWEVALGWRIRDYDKAEVARTKTVKNRMHVDVRLRDQAHLDELLQMGATVLSEHDSWRVMADPEGNEFDATHPD